MKCPYKDIECLHIDTLCMLQLKDCEDCEVIKEFEVIDFEIISP